MGKAPALSQTTRSRRPAAENAAEDDRRTLSAYVEKLLVEHLRKAGYLKAAKK